MTFERLDSTEQARPAAPAVPIPAAVPRRGRIFYGWRLVAAAFLASFTTAGVQGYVAGAFLVPMSDDLGWGRAEFLYGQTIGQFVLAFVGFFLGALVDRWGARPLMLIGTTILGTSLMITSTVTELWQWFLLRGVVSMLGSAMLGNLVVNVTLSKWFVVNRGQAIGLAAIGVSMAGVVLPPTMTWVIDEFGWRAGWTALAIGVLVLGYPAALMMRRQPEDMGLHPDGKSDEEMAGGGGAAAIADFANSFTRQQALRTRAMYLLILAFGLSSLGMITMIVLTIPYLTDSGFSRGTAALMVSVLAIPAAISKPVWGFMGDRWSDRLSTSMSFAINAAGLILIIVATIGHATAPLAIGYFIVGWGIGGQIPLQETIWASYFGRRYIGSVRSAAMPVTMLFSAVGPLAVATYYDRVGDYNGAMYAVAGAWAIAAVVILFARRPHPAHDPVVAPDVLGTPAGKA